MLIKKLVVSWCFLWILMSTVTVFSQSSPQQKTGSAPEAHPKPEVAQEKKPEKNAAGRLQKEYIKEQTYPFSYARALKVAMPPVGTLHIEGGARRNILIQSKITVEGDTEADLEALSTSIGYLINQDNMTWQLISVGPQIKLNKKEKKQAKGIASRLAKLPYRIDYFVRVPEYIDLEIEHYEGDVILANLFGTVQLNSQKGKITLAGLSGTVIGRVILGEVRVDLAGRSWRGTGIDFQMGAGNINLYLPNPYSVDLSLVGSDPLDVQYPIRREEGQPTDTPFGNTLDTRLGAGGATLKFKTQVGRISLINVNK